MGRHAHSGKARAWFDHTSEEQSYFCRFTQLTLLRLLTSENMLGRDTQSMAEARF
jgi:hypothetical protein